MSVKEASYISHENKTNIGLPSSQQAEEENIQKKL